MGFPLSQLLVSAGNARNAFVSGRRDAQQQSQEQGLKQALMMAQMKRQAEQDQLAQALQSAQMRHLDAQSLALGQPKAAAPVRDYVAEHAANRRFDIENPLPTADKPVSQGHVVDPVTGEVKFFDPTKPPSDLRINPAPKPPPQPSFAPITVGGGEGQPSVIKPFDTHTGKVGEQVGEAKPAPTRIESAMNTAAKARLEAAVSEMNNAHAGMEDYERKLSTGQASINGLQQFLGATGNSFTHDDPASRAIQSGALAILNRTNPELARYIRRGLSFAEGESMISQRPSDFRTKMTAFLSMASSGASPEMVGDIESRRKAILDPLNRNTSVAPKGGGRAGGAGMPSQSPTSGKPSLADRVQQLKAEGLSRDAARAKLIEEGYNLGGTP